MNHCQRRPRHELRQVSRSHRFHKVHRILGELIYERTIRSCRAVLGRGGERRLPSRGYHLQRVVSRRLYGMEFLDIAAAVGVMLHCQRAELALDIIGRRSRL